MGRCHRSIRRTYFLAALTLFLLSRHLKKKDHGRLKIVDIAGMYVAICSIALTILYFAWDLMRVYRQTF
jgi:hypothetical protein